MNYLVEYECDGEWAADRTFNSLEDAMIYAAGESACVEDTKHRVSELSTKTLAILEPLKGLDK